MVAKFQGDKSVSQSSMQIDDSRISGPLSPFCVISTHHFGDPPFGDLGVVSW